MMVASYEQRKAAFFLYCISYLYIRTVNKESLENEVADVHLNVPWAQQAEEKSLNVGCQKQTLQFMKIFILNFF